MRWCFHVATINVGQNVRGGALYFATLFVSMGAENVCVAK